MNLRRVGLLTAVSALAAATLSISGMRGDSEVSAAPQGVTVMATEAEARVAAVKGKHKVEVASGRDAQTTVYANPDGTFTREHHVQPIRTVRNGQWVAVDATIVGNANGTLAPKASTVDVAFSGGGNGPLATVSRMGRTLSISWLGALPSPVIEGKRATYRNLLPDVDLVVNADVDRFSHVLVVKTPQAARHPQLAEVAYGIQTKGLRLTLDHGRLVASDLGSNATVFAAPIPTMWDSGTGPAPGEDLEPARYAPESAKTAPLGVKVAGGKLLLTPDRTMLADPGLRYPIYIDPVWSTSSNSHWAMTDSGYSSNSYFDWRNAGNEDNQRVGKCPRDVNNGNNCNSSQVKRLFYEIPTWQYKAAGMQILEANFNVTLKHVENTSNAYGTELWRVNDGHNRISTGTTWENMPSGYDWAGNGGTHLATTTSLGTQDCSSTGTNLSLTATAAIQQANANGWDYTTFGMRSDREDLYRANRRFCHNAYVSVRYNFAPNPPANLATDPGTACATGANRPKTPKLPILKATPSDQDTTTEKLSVEFRAWWNGGSWSRETSPISGAGERQWNLDLEGLSIPDNVVVYWTARSSDWKEESNTRLSYSGDGPVCEFVLDTTKPLGPDVDSPQYLPEDAGETTPACAPIATVKDGIGNYGSFTFDSPSDDVTEYRFSFGGPSGTWSDKVSPGNPGGAATVRWVPVKEGPHWVTVRSWDGVAESAGATCTFTVTDGRGPVARWELDDAVGSAQARDAVGGNHATAGSTLVLGAVGPKGLGAATLDGGFGSYLTTATTDVVNTAKPFTVSVWAKLANTTKYQTVVSQDGTGEPGFRLGFDGTTKKWVFGLSDMDGEGDGGSLYVSSGVAAVAGVWTHLLASFDPHTNKMSLQVAGQTAATRNDRLAAWAAHGSVQIGRRTALTGYTDYFQGDVASVQLFDRLATADEIEAPEAAKRMGYWDFDRLNAAGTKAREHTEETANPANDAADVKALTLFGPELIVGSQGDPNDPEAPPGVTALMGAAHLRLNAAESDYLATTAQLLSPKTSFTVAARVNLVGDCLDEQIAFSQPGANRSRFKVRCLNGLWELVMSHSDSSGSAETVVASAPATATQNGEIGQHLAVTFNAVTGKVMLYIDGMAVTSDVITHVVVWPGTLSGLQVGRGFLSSGTVGAYFSGDIDEVRVYSGELNATAITQIASRTVLADS